jgi:hypothetical protein
MPDAVTLDEIRVVADGGFKEWLDDRKNRRSMAHHMERAKYTQMLKDGADQGPWTIGRKRRLSTRRCSWQHFREKLWRWF